MGKYDFDVGLGPGPFYLDPLTWGVDWRNALHLSFDHLTPFYIKIRKFLGKPFNVKPVWLSGTASHSYSLLLLIHLVVLNSVRL